MAAGRVIFPGLMPAEDSNGDRLPGAKCYVYADGTTTLSQFYTDNTLVTPLSNPVVADSVGVWPPMWASTALAFNVALTDGDGVPLPNGAWSGFSSVIDATLAAVALTETAAAAAAVSAAAAAASALAAAAAATGLNTIATSISPVLIGTGSKAFTLQQTGKPYAIGMEVAAAATSAPANRLTGRVTAFVDPLLTVDVSLAEGAGTPTAWTISQTAIGGVQSIAGEIGIVTAAEAKTALAITTADLTDLATFNAARDARAIAFAVAL